MSECIDCLIENLEATVSKREQTVLGMADLLIELHNQYKSAVADLVESHEHIDELDDTLADAELTLEASTGAVLSLRRELIDTQEQLAMALEEIAALESKEGDAGSQKGDLPF